MNSTQHLLEETEEAKEMRQHILNMLPQFDNPDLIVLALQLIKGGGVHQDFVPLLCIMALFKDRPRPPEEIYNFCQDAFYLLKNTLSKDDWEFVSQYSSMKDIESYSYYHSIQSPPPDKDDKTIEEVLQDILESQKLQDYWRAIAVSFFENEFSKGSCASICYKYNLLPISTILAGLMQDRDTLNLDNFELKDLPPELEHIRIKSISFGSCTLSRLPKATWQNPHVEHLGSLASVSIQNFRRLITYFPFYTPQPSWVFQKVFRDMSSRYTFEQIENRLRQEKYKLSKVPIQDRNKHYYQQRTFVYLGLGRYEIAQFCYQYIQTNYDIEDFEYYNLACFYAKKMDKKNVLKYMFSFLEQVGRLYEYRKVPISFIFMNEALKPYREDADVQILIKRYDELSYDEFEKFRDFYEVNVG